MNNSQINRKLKEIREPRGKRKEKLSKGQNIVFKDGIATIPETGLYEFGITETGKPYFIKYPEKLNYEKL